MIQNVDHQWLRGIGGIENQPEMCTKEIFVVI